MSKWGDERQSERRALARELAQRSRVSQISRSLTGIRSVAVEFGTMANLIFRRKIKLHFRIAPAMTP
jgi:hypothetical protein